MKKILYTLLGIGLAVSGTAYAINISVPSAPGNGYFLTSTSTGAYVASSTRTAYFGNYIGTSTAASTFGGHIAAGTTTATELMTIGRPASDNDYSTYAAWSGVVEGIFSASTPDQTVFAGSKTNTPFNLVMHNSSKLGIDTSGNVNILSNSLQFNKGGDSSTSVINLTQTSDGYLQAQRSGGADPTFTIFDVEAPAANTTEATMTTGLGTTNRNWVDWTDEAYATDNSASINVGAKGTATVQPFVIRFWPKTTFVHVSDIPYSDWFDPSGAIGFGYASSTAINKYDKTIPLQIASSTAVTNFAIDSSPGTHIFQVNENGNVGIGSTTPGSLLSVGNTTGINFTTATSTFNSTGGINLKSGCFAIAGVCLSTSGSGTVTQVSTDSTLTGGPITTTGTLGINLANPNTFTKLQQFNGNASTSMLTVSGNSYLTANVGIGTTSPTNALEVVGTSYFTNTMTLQSSTNAQINQNRNAVTNSALGVFRTNNTDEWSFGLRNDSTNTFHLRDAVNSVDGISIKQGASPLVGIGTSTQTAIFQATAAASNATTSIQFGKANQTKGTCTTYYDTAGTPVYMFFAAGATSPTYTSTQPSGCQN